MSTFAAANYSDSSRIVADGAGGIGAVRRGWAEYPDVDFGAAVMMFQAQIDPLARHAGTLQLRLDSAKGKLIGKLALTGTPGTATIQTTTVKGATGVHNLYLVFVGPAKVGNIQSFTFAPAPPARPATSTFTALNYAARRASLQSFTNTMTTGGAWAEFMQIDFGAGMTTFQAAIAASAKSGGRIQLRLDSPTGPLIGTLKIAGTGDMNNFTLQSTAIKHAKGVHNLYMVFTGRDATGNIQSFSFA